MTTFVSLAGFWVALALIVFASAAVVRNTLRRDSDGLIPADAVTGIGIMIVAPLVAGVLIAITSGGILTATVNGHHAAVGSTNVIPQLAQRVADSSLLSYAIAGVSLLWWYALLSALVATVMRHRQQNRLRQHAITLTVL